ncbi:MAG: polysaccharide pyruvyl transferase family protein [Planctomycetota bacterium]|jgi:polysaccharide pyruvyl transferase WcaK-like protein
MDVGKTKKLKVCLQGATFDTGNMGVSALAESSAKCVLNNWPKAEVTLLARGRDVGEHRLKLMGKEVSMRKFPIRFCKNVVLPNHFCVLLLNALLLRLLPWKRFKNFLSKINPYVKTLLEAELVFDITAGDSFSDTYGLRRFLLIFLCKFLIVQFRKKLLLLPQTYGPYNKQVTKALARYILNYATVVYSRDRSGVDYVKNLLKAENPDGKIRFLPDVAFVLDSHRPGNPYVSSLEKIKAENTVFVGLNISGLLFHGGYTKNNMFKLSTDYCSLIHSIIDLLMEYDSTSVLLVPHVFPLTDFQVESDLVACRKVYESTAGKFKGRVLLTRGEYNHNEIKYIIGLCDFFIGSRMHACIAALSQNVPTVGLAYSRKFQGVFETVDAEQSVVDMRYAGTEEILTTIAEAFEQREATAGHLKAIIPGVQQQILNVFEGIS